MAHRAALVVRRQSDHMSVWRRDPIDAATNLMVESNCFVSSRLMHRSEPATRDAPVQALRPVTDAGRKQLPWFNG
ncbi:hypothetical protein AGR6A_Lc100069 [Agrobacterium sp. NCPPB 925]|nr:hypothetical protein AGR6A_Lc100069 [Agrobacterium sp. NCPPB 925]